MLKGPQVALPTPFRNDEIDEAALRGVVEFAIAGGTGGLLVLGSTGEAAALSEEEYARVARISVETARRRVPVVVGCGTNSTRKTIHSAEQAKAAGADAILVVAPYYTRPSQEGLYRHFTAIHDAVDLPMVIYNHPGRCAVDIAVDTVIRLAKLPRVIGMKESSQDLSRLHRLHLALGNDFLFISGDAPNGLAYLIYGGSLAYMGLTNFVPEVVAKIHQAWDRGDARLASELYRKWMPLNLAMSVETNPVPLKYMLSLVGRCTEEVRLPLCELSDANKAVCRAALEKVGLLAAREERPLVPA
jgi:4-hydroxy-tetrahydrodipicolinate synthase